MQHLKDDPEDLVQSLVDRDVSKRIDLIWNGNLYCKDEPEYDLLAKAVPILKRFNVDVYPPLNQILFSKHKKERDGLFVNQRLLTRHLTVEPEENLITGKYC